MKKNRYIPFGYAMQNGEIIAHPIESDAVRSVFKQYLAGVSLRAIAEAMESQGVIYNEGKRWNMHMVNRMVANTRYCGDAGYPAIIDHQDYIDANHTKSGKYTGIPLPVSPAVASVRSKAVCAECGGRYTRRSDSRNGESWKCYNSGCANSFKADDEYMLVMVLGLLNAAIENPDLIRHDNAESGAELTVMRLQNDVNRELDKQQIDADAVRSLIFACAAEKYAYCPDGKMPLEREFANTHLMDELDAGFFDSTVSRVIITKDGAVRLNMVNGVILAL